MIRMRVISTKSVADRGATRKPRFLGDLHGGGLGIAALDDAAYRGADDLVAGYRAFLGLPAAVARSAGLLWLPGH